MKGISVLGCTNETENFLAKERVKILPKWFLSYGSENRKPRFVKEGRKRREKEGGREREASYKRNTGNFLQT